MRIPGEEQRQIRTSRDTDVATTKISGANGSRRGLAESEHVCMGSHMFLRDTKVHVFI